VVGEVTAILLSTKPSILKEARELSDSKKVYIKQIHKNNITALVLGGGLNTVVFTFDSSFPEPAAVCSCNNEEKPGFCKHIIASALCIKKRFSEHKTVVDIKPEASVKKINKEDTTQSIPSVSSLVYLLKTGKTLQNVSYVTLAPYRKSINKKTGNTAFIHEDVNTLITNKPDYLENIDYEILSIIKENALSQQAEQSFTITTDFQKVLSLLETKNEKLLNFEYKPIEILFTPWDISITGEIKEGGMTLTPRISFNERSIDLPLGSRYTIIKDPLCCFVNNTYIIPVKYSGPKGRAIFMLQNHQIPEEEFDHILPELLFKQNMPITFTDPDVFKIDNDHPVYASLYLSEDMGQLRAEIMLRYNDKLRPIYPGDPDPACLIINTEGNYTICKRSLTREKKLLQEFTHNAEKLGPYKKAGSNTFFFKENEAIKLITEVLPSLHFP
jgi:hypothetical protein